MDFEVESTLYVSDPCYYKEERHRNPTTRVLTLEGAKPGTWVGVIIYHSSFKNRVQQLVSVHGDHDDAKEMQWKKRGVVDVDSGQMGIYDYDYYPIFGCTNDFYTEACALTSTPKRGGVVTGYKETRSCFLDAVNIGVVSSSGFGDGLYGVDTWEQEGKIVGVRVTFL
jgi:hypothetical protein